MSRSLPLSPPKPKRKHPSAEIALGFDFTRYFLRDGESLTGTPTVSSSPSGLTFTSIAVNTSTFVNDAGETVAVGKGVVCKCTGGTANVDYVVTCTVPSTSGTPSQVLPAVVTIECRSS